MFNKFLISICILFINESKQTATVTQTAKQGEYLNYQKYKEFEQQQRSMAHQLLQQQQLNTRSTKWKMSQHNKHANISNLLDNLLRGYDNSIRPGFGGAPAVVDVDIMVRSMGPVSEVDMTYSMDCYFRQSWVDRRLAFKGGANDTLALSISMLARIWKPDTYFYNGKQSYLHTITTPNKFVRIYPNGRVLYSSRLTIKAGCPMSLEDFPMDIQKCPLKFGSFGYTTVDVLYNWNVNRTAVAIAEDMKLSQFDLVDCPAGNSTDTVYRTSPYQKAQYSMLTVNFVLKRHMGNFLIQVYGPCCLLVVLSWVSFWLNREATADRVSLGITTVLTMTFLGLEARTDLPKVPYPTALDFFVFLSFAFIFATIIQFAVVHYFTKYGSGECYFIIDDFDSESETEDDVGGEGTLKTLTSHRSMPSELNGSTDTTLFEVIPLSEFSIPITPERDSKPLNCEWSCFIPSIWRKRRKSKGQMQHQEMVSMNSMIEESITDEDILSTQTPHRKLSFRRQSELQIQQQQQFKRRRKRTPQFNSVSKIDRASRVIFPLLFMLINVFYWYAYLSRSSRINNNEIVT